ncbi:MAG: DUF4270 domain-containing protein [Bacteroidales bacterium]|nr:DUF4270 domain-containing protein [Bacteroidales bacterium]
MTGRIWRLAGAGALGVFFLFSSCSSDDSTMGNYLVETSTRTVFVDTLSVRLSVLAKDSTVTSNTGALFVGKFNDPLTGESEAKSFIEFTRTADSESNEYPRFDSVTLVLRPSGSYYGDTLQPFGIKISKLKIPIEMNDDGYRYSTSSAPVESASLVEEVRLNMRGPSQKEVEVTLPRELGEKMFQGVFKNETEWNADNYLKTFPGLAIESVGSDSCIYGFSVTDSTCMIRIYYRITGSADVERKTMTFKANSAKQFNHFKMSNFNPKLPESSKEDPVPTGQTGNMGFVTTGAIPLYTRMDFPTLSGLLVYGEIILIEKARLIVRPVRHSYDRVPLPPELYLYEHNPANDTRGNYLSVQTSTSTSPLNGNLNGAGKDKNVHETYYYDYDITSFISSQLNATGYDKIALSIDIPSSTSGSTPFQRVVFGDRHFFRLSDAQSKDNQIMLEVTYSIYHEY